MKTKGFLKAALITVMFLGLGWSAEAQPITPDVTVSTIADVDLATDLVSFTTEDADTVTTGGRYPYVLDSWYESLSAASKTFFTSSHYKWQFSGATTTIDSYNSGYSPLTTVATPDNDYYSDFKISVLMPTIGAYTLKTNEYSKPNVGTGCIGTEQTHNLLVVAKPTAKITTASVGGCGLNSTVNLPLTLNGAGPFEVYYQVAFSKMDGTTETKKYVDVVGVVSKIAEYTTLTIPLEIGNELTAGDPADMATYGTYAVTLLDVIDRFSNKSLTYVQGDVTGSGTYTISSYPTPVTKPINHIKNIYN